MTHVRFALASLAHPLALCAALLLLANALWFQPTWPGWWTGKLGDLAWLALAPLLTCLALALVLPAGRVTLCRLAVALSAGAFVAVKTLAPANAAVSALYLLVAGRPAKLALDPTDLLALPGLLVAYWIWRRATLHTAARPRLQAAGLLLAATALLADSPAPQNFGIVCVARQGDTIVAASEEFQHGYFGDTTRHQGFQSTDGGQTWSTLGEPASGGTPVCARAGHEANWTLERAGGTTSFLFMSNQGVYRSDDGGKSYQQEYATGAPLYDAIDSPDGGMLVAAGPEGVLLRSADGAWRAVPMPTP
jgi:hypothetical protein